MEQKLPHPLAAKALPICEMGVKMQKLISQCLTLGFMQDAKALTQAEQQLFALWQEIKQRRLSNEEQQEAGYTHYIWHTVGDSKVRSRHAVNDGKIFAWNDPPPTGHPGEDYNCRCWAEPYVEGESESFSQEVTSSPGGRKRWPWYYFVLHYYYGGGQDLTLTQVGHLTEVIEESKKDVFKGVMRQLIKEARETKSGSLNDTFENSYSYEAVSFIHGDSTVRGRYTGHVRQVGGMLHIEATVAYNFSDTFTDPLDIRESNTGTSNPQAIEANELIDSEAGGQYFHLKDSWTTKISAKVKYDAAESDYK